MTVRLNVRAVVVQQDPLVSVVKGTLSTAQQIEETRLIRQLRDGKLKGGIS